MPHLFPFAGNHNIGPDDAQELGDGTLQIEPQRQRKGSVLGRLQSLQRWLKRDDEEPDVVDPAQEEGAEQQDGLQTNSTLPVRRRSLLARGSSRNVVPELPRPQTFRRQNSEKRDRLLPVEPTALERRAVSEERRAGSYRRLLGSPVRFPLPRMSAPEVGSPNQNDHDFHAAGEPPSRNSGEDAENADEREHHWQPLPLLPPMMGDEAECTDVDAESEKGPNDRELQVEMDAKWILNLSMHFRDKSNREKFFVTYAQQPNHWRRVTVSCDYRRASEDKTSLESELSSLSLQRDKSREIYKAIRDSLAEIQFYDTVTNLKLETEKGRLHVHVTEDVNEIIPYPSSSLVSHIECPRYREDQVTFESHLSGFVYRVKVEDDISGTECTFIKKEIPGPDTVDEFLYEVNALDSLRQSESVIQFHGLITDATDNLIKGLLITYASQGALVDTLYDYKDSVDHLPWSLRGRWARQVIQGLSDIHEAGFVQGDFTLSNIVIDKHDDAKIIDINRRGCPVGWEPPELGRLIESGQRIGMYIGVKSDLYQLGMVLWAIGAREDEPERQETPLPDLPKGFAPSWYDEIIRICLNQKPQARKSAAELLRLFDTYSREVHYFSEMLEPSEHSVSTRRSDKQYIDPKAAVELSDIAEHARGRANTGNSDLTSGHCTYADAPASNMDDRYASSGSYLVADRGRRKYSHGQRPGSPYDRPVSSNTSVSDNCERERSQRRYAEENLARDDVRHSTGKAQSSGEVDYADDGGVGGLNYQDSYLRHVSSWTDSGGSVVDRSASPERKKGVSFGPPLHQDSGFAEGLDELLDQPDSTNLPRSSNLYQHSEDPEHAAERHQPQNEQLQQGSSLSRYDAGRNSQLSLPLSFYTPLATPLPDGQDAKTDMAGETCEAARDLTDGQHQNLNDIRNDQSAILNEDHDTTKTTDATRTYHDSLVDN